MKDEMREAKAREKATVGGKTWRFTVLTERLIRMEYDENGQFTDAPTLTVTCRDFPVPEFRVIEEENSLEIVTERLHVYYDKKRFSKEGLSVQLTEGFAVFGSIWNYGDELNDLRGTTRTLDNADGAVPLEHGLMSRDGFTVLEDAKTALIASDGWVVPRTSQEEDLYFFGYGHDYLGCLKDFYRLSGAVPLLPRFTLGNWWSRFYSYTEESYLALMDRFRQKKIPFSTAVLDMGWHLTDIPKKYGNGWTGYTWDKKYFPDPKRFLEKLHERGLHVTLNVHPADGVRAHEDAYLPMAKELGVDYENEDKIPFDASDRRFMEAYFKYLHHPHEDAGVDFWWLDWQQQSRSKVPGMDTLWILNHLHFLDSGRDGRRSLTFSRYAGIGSHRYPIGFSGDTVTTWDSLAFQPYFTVNATNAGYTWWSHDIGGHQKGIRDDEMVVRWIQFGVFSPIMRLHSTANNFYGKEPWNYNPVAETVITSFMQLRHKMIPYLYTMNYRTHKEGMPLMCPMYYRHDVQEAYDVPNEYYFGDMIVCPITKPADTKTLLAEVDAWIPDGIYHDFFTGQIYCGGRRMTLYRNLNAIPVLVPVGGILTLAGDYEECHRKNPNKLEVLVFAGADGSFSMYEDDCSERTDAEAAWTHFNYRHGKTAHLHAKIEGKKEVIPADRVYYVYFRGVEEPKSVRCADGKITAVNWAYDAERRELSVTVADAEVLGWELEIEFTQDKVAAADKKQLVYELLHRAQIAYDEKEKIYTLVQEEECLPRLFASLHTLEISSQIYGAIMEILTCDYRKFND